MVEQSKAPAFFNFISMEKTKCRVLEIVVFIGLILNVISFTPAVAEEKGLQTYIVYTKKPNPEVSSKSLEDLKSWYEQFLPTPTDSSNQEPRVIHAYRNVATGFTARLTADEVKAVEKKEGFLFAQPDRTYSLHTTHSPSFLGLNRNLGLWNSSTYGRGVIIGLLDTGIWPDHPSFNDANVPPPPAKWKGKCDFNGTVCNNKLIGARDFVSGKNGRETEPPFDEVGHGTHTSSTAAGNFVDRANVLGNANGTAVGMAPYAHLAMYRVCSFGCSGADILAAMDAAVEDGVDVLSLSLGGGSAPFYDDPIALGAFTAIQKGIFVSCSAGNEGPYNASLSNEAPWILTVGASTIDRKIKATAKLGNGAEYDGESLFQPKAFNLTLLPLIYAGANGNETSAFCEEGSLSSSAVEGKIVVCDRGGGAGRIDKGVEVKNAGGAGMILVNQETDGYSTLADPHVLPATHVSYEAGLKIKAYINSTQNPTATIIFKGTVIGDPLAPEVTSFSSRGPSLSSPGILKPDIIGPGVSILAAWPPPFSANSPNTEPAFNIISGTSMSCPHLSGIAALLKSSHPDWSPAAIKSAIMTTANSVNMGGQPIVDEKHTTADIFATGAGHVNPSKANDPGLVYDIKPEDYIPYLCGLNYTDREIEIITQTNVSCSEVGKIAESQLNYPSISVQLGSETQGFTRTVTNVGPTDSTYTFILEVPRKTGMSVNPPKLTFSEENKTATFYVEFIPEDGAGEDGNVFAEGSLTWVSGKYSVRSPLSVTFV